MDNKAISALQNIQSGNSESQDEIDARIVYEYINENYLGRYIGKYLYMNNSAIDVDDVKSEFWVGVVKNIKVAKLDMGDPFAWLATRGRFKALEYIKISLRSNVRQICYDCGHLSKFYGSCRICGSQEVGLDSSKTIYYDEIHSHTNNGIDDSESLRIFFKKFFTGRRLKIYELITDIDGDNTPYATGNYQKEIAGRLGISAPAVAKHIRIIRQTVRTLLDE